MAFDIELYHNNSRDNARVKNLDSQIVIHGTLRENCSLIDPTFKIETSVDLSKYNYMRIPRFSRYYFIRNIISVRNNLFEISAHCDVLSSAGDRFDDCMGIVRRQENTWNLYLDDGAFKAYSNPNIVQKSFPSGFDLSNACYILAVAGS